MGVCVGGGAVRAGWLGQQCSRNLLDPQLPDVTHSDKADGGQAGLPPAA